ncbi:MAG: hypothetical protein LBS11_02345 [Oscillospiraceae bacterium]|nr:hypothetical protein [Oscillospiraceae bacterium]
MAAGCAARADEPPLYGVGWSRVLGGEGDGFTGITVAGDGRIWLAGSAVSAADDALGGVDGWVAVLDSEGVELWSRRYGGSGDDRLIEVATLSDGGAVILGETSSSDGQVKNYRGGVDAWVIRVDARGELVWRKCLGGTTDDGLAAMRVMINVVIDSSAVEDRIFLAGWSTSYNNDLNINAGGKDAWVCAIRLEDGRSVWHYQIGEAGDDWFNILLPDRLGLTAIGVSTRVDAQGGQRVTPLLVTIGTDGHEVSVFRLQLKEDAWISDAVTTSDGWLLAGKLGGVNSDAWLGRVSSDGSLTATYMEGNTNGAMSIIRQYTPNITLAVGVLESKGSALVGTHGGRDAWAVGLTRDRVQWEQALGGNGETTPLLITRRSDGRYVIALSTTAMDGDLMPRDEPGVGWLTLLDTNGNLLRHAVIAPNADQRYTAAAAVDGGILFMGKAVDSDGIWRAAVTKAVP